MIEIPTPPGGLDWLAHGDESYLQTRARLPEFARSQGLRVEVVARSELVLEDVDLLRRIAKRSALCVEVEMMTPHRRLARQLEPAAPSPEARLAIVERLADAGLHVGVRAIPILPAINDSLEDLRLLFQRSRTYGAQYVRASPARGLTPEEELRFLDWLGATWPQKRPRYRALFAAKRMGELGWQRRIRGYLATLRSHTGLAAGPDMGPEPSVNADPCVEAAGQLAFPGLGVSDAA